MASSFLKNWRNFSKQLLCLTPGNSCYGRVFLLNFDLVLEAVFWLYFKVAKHACILDCYHGSLYSEWNFSYLMRIQPECICTLKCVQMLIVDGEKKTQHNCCIYFGLYSKARSKTGQTFKMELFGKIVSEYI